MIRTLIIDDVQLARERLKRCLDGFGVLEALRDERAPAVIFVTAYNEYAIQAFEVNALDYLLKPVDCARLSKAVERASSHLAQPAPRDDLDTRFRAMLEDIKASSKFLKRLTIKLTGHTILLPTDEIDWIESYGNYLKVHAGRESHLIRGTMQSLEVKLDPETFVRVHRSAIVNIEKIKEIYPRSNGDQDLVLQNGQQLMLSRKYRDRFLAALGDL
jgi:two-component system LytT family response regulator